MTAWFERDLRGDERKRSLPDMPWHQFLVVLSFLNLGTPHPAGTCAFCIASLFSRDEFTNRCFSSSRTA